MRRGAEGDRWINRRQMCGGHIETVFRELWQCAQPYSREIQYDGKGHTYWG